MFTTSDLFYVALLFTAFGIGIGLMAACWKPKNAPQPRINMKV